MRIANRLFGKPVSTKFNSLIKQLYHTSRITRNERTLLNTLRFFLIKEFKEGSLLPHLELPKSNAAENDYVLAQGKDGFMSMIVECKPGYIGDIHDHATWSLSIILKGTLAHDIYDHQNNCCILKDSITLKQGQITSLGTNAIHRIRNPSTSETAVSLHIYGKDLRTQKRFQYHHTTGHKIPNPNVGFTDVYQEI